MESYNHETYGAIHSWTPINTKKKIFEHFFMKLLLQQQRWKGESLLALLVQAGMGP